MPGVGCGSNASRRTSAYAARVLRKSPGFTLAAVLMLAIGIGVNVAVFGFFDLMVLRPLNVKDPATLLRFHRRGLIAVCVRAALSGNGVLPRELPNALGRTGRKFHQGGGGRRGETAQRKFCDGELFPRTGRERRFSAGCSIPRWMRLPAPSRWWSWDTGTGRRHFGADPLVVGRTIRLNGKAATVVGVAAGDFSGLSLSEPTLWAPVTQQPYFTTGSRLLTDFSVESPGVQMWGRLAPGQNPKAAEEELRSLAGELRKQHPTAIWEDERLPSEPGAYASSSLIGNRRGTGTEQRDPVYPIFALVGTLTLLILAVACGNLGSMLLARGVARQREIAIRVAIGAGNGRLIRQLFTESLLLAMMGSMPGLAVGNGVLRGLLVAANGPTWLDLRLRTGRVVVFALAAGFASAILFGLTPALEAGRQGHRAVSARAGIDWRAGSQPVCALVIVAGLLGRTLDHATSTDRGFEGRQVVSIDRVFPGTAILLPGPRQISTCCRTVLRLFRVLLSVSLAISPPLGHVTIKCRHRRGRPPVSMQLNSAGSPVLRDDEKIPLRPRPATRNTAIRTSPSSADP